MQDVGFTQVALIGKTAVSTSPFTVGAHFIGKKE